MHTLCVCVCVCIASYQSIFNFGLLCGHDLGLFNFPLICINSPFESAFVFSFLLGSTMVEFSKTLFLPSGNYILFCLNRILITEEE